MIVLDLAELRLATDRDQDYWVLLDAASRGRLFHHRGRLVVASLGLADEQVQLAPCPACDGTGATGHREPRTCPRCGGSGVDDGSDWWREDEPAPCPVVPLRRSR